MATWQAPTDPDPPRHHECPLCLESYQSPRILPCFHTFCLACLERLVQTSCSLGTFTCPTCRSVTQIPVGGVGKFQVNFYVEAAMEDLNISRGGNVPNCDVCGVQTAVSKCVECEQFACDNCTAVHARFGGTRSHTVLKLNAQHQASPAIVKERYCNIHKEEKIRFFCSQCKCVLCRDCKLTAHEGHSTTDLSEKTLAAKEMLLNVSKKSRTLAPKLRKSLQSAQQHKHDLSQTKAQILSTLRQRTGDIKKIADDCLAQAEQNLASESGAIEKEATQTVEDMQQQLVCLESLCDHVEQVARAGCSADILSLPDQLNQFFGTTGKQKQKTPGAANVSFQAFTNESWRKTVHVTYRDDYDQSEQLEQMFSAKIGHVSTISMTSATMGQMSPVLNVKDNTSQGSYQTFCYSSVFYQEQNSAKIWQTVQNALPLVYQGENTVSRWSPSFKHRSSTFQGQAQPALPDISKDISKDISDIRSLLQGWDKPQKPAPKVRHGGENAPSSRSGRDSRQRACYDD